MSTEIKAGTVGAPGNGRVTGRPGRRSPMLAVSAQEAETIRAVPVRQITTDAASGQWTAAPQVTVPLSPQNIAIPRLTEAGVKEVRVKAQYDDGRVAVWLEWGDSMRDVAVETVHSFRDAVAIQFPAKGAVSPPFYCMGAPTDPVVIYQWKADWQDGRDLDVDHAYPNMVADEYAFSGKATGEMPQAADYIRRGDKAYVTAWAVGNLLADRDVQARTRVERLVSEGFGSLEPAGTQDGLADGFWKDGVWRAVIAFPRKQEGFTFQPGEDLPIAFAAWDGSRNERNGQKAFSLWHTIGLERGGPAAEGPAPAVLGGVGAAVAAAIGGLLLFRMRRMGSRRPEE